MSVSNTGRARPGRPPWSPARSSAEEPGARPTPYFWSDQFGLRLQHVGSAEGWERIVLDGDETSLAARYLAQDGRLVAALLVNRPQQVGSLRRELAPKLLAA